MSTAILIYTHLLAIGFGMVFMMLEKRRADLKPLHVPYVPKEGKS